MTPTGSDYLHDGWCMTQTHTAGTCNCHYGEIARLQERVRELEAREEAARVPAMRLHAMAAKRLTADDEFFVGWISCAWVMERVENILRALAASEPPGEEE